MAHLSRSADIGLAAVARPRRRTVPSAITATRRGRDWLSLADAFEIGVDGREVHVPPCVQRLLAYLALTGRHVSRSQCAGALWEHDGRQRASSSLRTTLWRLNRSCGDLVVREQDRLGLVADVEVDVGEPADLSRRLSEADDLSDHSAMATILSEPVLLPTWSDTWLVIERERLRLVWLNALEATANQLARHRPAPALLAATAAVGIEPLQESAWRLIIAINLQQGNVASAHRAYRAYRSMLATELGVEPSALMKDLLASNGAILHAE